MLYDIKATIFPIIAGFISILWGISLGVGNYSCEHDNDYFFEFIIKGTCNIVGHGIAGILLIALGLFFFIKAKNNNV